MIASEEKVIGEYTYTVTRLDAVTGIDVLTKLVNVVGPAFQDDEFAAFCKSLSGADLKYFISKFAAGTTVHGGDIQPDKAPSLLDIWPIHFAGEYGRMTEWLVFCLRLNFSSFFAGGLGRKLLAEARAQITSGSKSPST